MSKDNRLVAGEYARVVQVPRRLPPVALHVQAAIREESCICSVNRDSGCSPREALHRVRPTDVVPVPVCGQHVSHIFEANTGTP